MNIYYRIEQLFIIFYYTFAIELQLYNFHVDINTLHEQMEKALNFELLKHNISEN